MANNPYINKVQLANGQVLIDLTADTVDTEHLMQGYTAHDATGAVIIGTATGGAPWKINVENTTPWQRPSSWPNLDSIPIGANEEVCYLTYDLTKTPGYAWMGLYCTVNGSGAKWIIERGHLEGTSFVADDHVEEATKTRYTTELDPENGDVQLYRITSTSGEITQLQFASIGSTNATCFNNFAQPCVERAGRLPHLTTLTGTRGARTTYYHPATQWLEKDSLAPGELAQPTSLTGYYNNAYKLRVVDFSHWKTANWTKMANLSNMFAGCFSLDEIDLSPLDTSTWAITTTATMFSQCYCLKSINFGTMDTSNWAVTTMASMFANCWSLEEIDLTFLDTEKWAVTTLATMFQYDYNLKSIDMHDLDTSNWAVTTMANMFNECYSLQDINLSGWDTSEWAVTTLDGMFKTCYALHELTLPNWDTADWPVTTIANMFANCYSLEQLDVSNWSTTNWGVTTMASMFSGCWSIEEIDLDSWDMSNWKVTTVASMCQYCRSLKSFVPHWQTADWPLATVTSLFAYCVSLIEADLSNLDATSWAVTGGGTVVQNCYNLVTFKFPSDAGAPITTTSNMFSGCYSLQHLRFTAVNAAWTLSGFNLLTRESLLDCINKLPQTSTAKTFTLGQENKLKLTDAELAIATGKGWTIA